MSVSDAVAAMKADVFQQAGKLHINIVGIAVFDPVVAEEVREKLIKDLQNLTPMMAGHRAQSHSAGQRPGNYAGSRSGDSDFETFIVELLKGEDRPMSLEQIFEAVQSGFGADMARGTSSSVARSVARAASRRGLYR